MCGKKKKNKKIKVSACLKRAPAQKCATKRAVKMSVQYAPGNADLMKSFLSGLSRIGG
jgi:hypothetical protein